MGRILKRAAGAKLVRNALAIGAAGLGGMFAFSQLSGKATKEENEWKYPSDDLIDLSYSNGRSSTYAIDIDAPAYAVYRHLKQIGCDKAGSYSSEFLERTFARLPFFNSFEIQEQWQGDDALQPGDTAGFDFTGMSMEWTDVVPGKYISQWVDTKHPPKAPGSFAFRYPGMKHYGAAWCFYVVPLKGERTRLINHWRIGFEPNNQVAAAINWINIELIGGCMAHLQNIYLKRVAEFRKKPQLQARIKRAVLGGKVFGYGTSAGRYDGTVLYEGTHNTWLRFGRQDPACNELRPPVTENEEWPPTGPGTPWADDVDEEYYRGWSEPPFSWNEQIRQKIEGTYLKNWGKDHEADAKAAAYATIDAVLGAWEEQES